MEKRSNKAAPATPPRARMAPFAPDPALIAIGKTLAVQIFNSRDWSSLRPYLNDATPPRPEPPTNLRRWTNDLHGE